MCKRVALVLVLLSLSVSSALAKDPPLIPGTPPPWLPGQSEDDLRPAVYDGPIVPTKVTPFLSSARLPLNDGRGPRMHATSSARVGGANPRPSVVRPFDVPSWVNVVYGAANASAEPDLDVETAIYARTGSNTSTVTTYMHLDRSTTVPHYLMRWATSTDLTSDAATFSRGMFTIPSGYQESVDPTLAGNPYADGQRPGAIYSTGLLGNRPTSNSRLENPMAIRVWASDDGGFTWSSGQTLASTTSSSTYSLDKPVSDVSWYPHTRGYLYVAWVEVQNDGANRIVVRRNWGGLWTRCRPTGGACNTAWDAPVTLRQGAPGEQPYAPQVVVNHNNGHVYVFWMTALGQLNMSRSVDGGVTWSAPITLFNGIQVTGNAGYLTNGLRAVVVPTIRYNTATQQVVAVWHATNSAAATNEAAIYFATFDASSISGPLPLPPPIVDDSGAEIQPAIDNDNAGNMLVTYYDTTGNEEQYRLTAICVAPNGTRTCGPTAVSGNHPTRDANGFRIFIGDYHDTFYFTYPDFLGARWNASWSASSGAHDVLISGIK